MPLNIKPNTFQQFTQINMLIILQLKKELPNMSPKKEFNKEPNIKPFKDKLSTQLKNNR